MGVLSVSVFLLNRDLSSLAALYSASVRIAGLRWDDAVSLLMFSALLGWLGAWLSVTRHLWRIEAR